MSGDGLVNLTDLGILLAELGQTDRHHYELAVYNMNSARALGSLTVHLPPGTQVSAVGHKDGDHHSGEPYATDDWAATVSAASVSWATSDRAADPLANALRWGTLFNFWFDADAAPAALNNVTLGVFEPGTVNEIDVPLP